MKKLVIGDLVTGKACVIQEGSTVRDSLKPLQIVLSSIGLCEFDDEEKAKAVLSDLHNTDLNLGNVGDFLAERGCHSRYEDLCESVLELSDMLKQADDVMDATITSWSCLQGYEDCQISIYELFE